MEEFGFNKIDEDDMFDPKQSMENMRSLHEIEGMQKQSDETSLSDVEINSRATSIDPTEDVTEEVSASITPMGLSDVTIPEGRVNPLPEPIEYGDRNMSSSIQTSPLENMKNDESLTVETSKNLQVNKQLSFDLKNPNYTPKPPQTQSTYEKNMSTTPASNDNFDFEIPSSLSTNTASSRRYARKNATPEWRSRHG